MLEDSDTFRYGGGRVLIWNLPSSSTEEDVGRVGAAPWSKGTDLANSALSLGICISSDEFSVQRELKWEFYFLFFKGILSIEMVAVGTPQ